MKDCLFCKIVKGEIPCYKIYEDKDFLAFLDIYPNTKGMTLIIPKKHYSSDSFDMPREAYINLMLISKKIAKILEKKLNVKRVALVMEGMGVDHVHIKLYPLHGLKEKFTETWVDKRIFFQKYQGYITTLMGKRMSDKKLKELVKKITEKS